MMLVEDFKKGINNSLKEIQSWVWWHTPLIPALRRRIRAPDFWTPALQEKILPAESALTTGTQVRVGLRGVLTEANRITGGTSSSQRQLEH